MIYRLIVVLFLVVANQCLWAASTAMSHTEDASSSVLSSGKWKKFKTDQKGIHKLTYSDLKSWGFSNPSNVKVFGNGGIMLPKMNNVSYPDDLVQNPVLHAKDGSNEDCIFFFVAGTIEWSYNNSDDYFEHQQNLYSDYTYYYLTEDISDEKTIVDKNSISGTAEFVVENYTDFQFSENEKYNLLGSGRTWYGEKLSPNEKATVSFDVGSTRESSDLRFKTSVLGRAGNATNLAIKYQNELVDSLKFSKVILDNKYVDYASVRTQIFNVEPDDDIDISFFYDTDEGNALCWIDYVSINCIKPLNLNNSQFTFRSKEALNDGVLEYRIQTSTNDLRIWDVSNSLEPKNILYNLDGKTAVFKAEGGQLNEYVVFDVDASSFPTLKLVGDIDNQDIHSLPGFDMIIVTHPNFLTQAQELAEFHRVYDKLDVLTVTTGEVYNEFSSGLPDPAAIRNMFRYFYKKEMEGAESKLKYALLFGDGSYDNKNFNGKKNNFIPTYQTKASINNLSSFVSDDFYGLLDEDEGEYFGYIDIGIGRLPVKNTMEADDVLAKIYNYTSVDAMGDWRNSVCFIADDEDSNGHLDDAEKLANKVETNYPGFKVEKIYFDAYSQESTPAGERYPEVTEAINRQVDEGVLILNYIGHANSSSLSGENVLEISDIESWNNYNNLPIFVTATCEFGRFDADNTSAGETVLLNPTGGGIGLFTTTRVVFSYSNYVLNNNFYNYVFEQDDNGENYRMGDIIRLAKNATYGDTNKRNFTLLADPAIRLSYPKLHVKTTTINSNTVNEELVQIGAMQKVDVSGEVVDYKGNKVEDFNGEITPIVYDKPLKITTLANDGGRTRTFEVYDNIIYKGLSSVKNGDFNYEFIVPKDISYKQGMGKIFYYLSDGEIDGNGAFDNFSIGGSSGTPIVDELAPQIDLFMNNESFLDGDEVGINSILIAKLFDENGINTVGTGIGHDITGYLDDNDNDLIELNDYYQSEIDNYKKGEVRYPIYDIEPGNHSITIKVWDVFNNSNTAKINFVVKDDFSISDIRNVPNPVVSYTDFEVEHNLPGESFIADLKIYSMDGRMIENLKSTVSSAGSSLLKLRWNVNDSKKYFNRYNVLLYSLNLTTHDGQSSHASGKLFINGIN